MLVVHAREEFSLPCGTSPIKIRNDISLIFSPHFSLLYLGGQDKQRNKRYPKKKV